MHAVYIFSIKYRYSDIILKNPKLNLKHLVEYCNRLCRFDRICYCIDRVSVTSVSRYESRSLTYIQGLLALEWAEAFAIVRNRGLPDLP